LSVDVTESGNVVAIVLRYANEAIPIVTIITETLIRGGSAIKLGLDIKYYPKRKETYL
jgi:hypothetical protein